MTALEHLETPFVAIDLDIMERNLQYMQQLANAHRLGLRPHTKTHKQPTLARRQYELGARGLTVARLDEAEMLLSAGLYDVLIAYPLVGELKAFHLATLITRGLRPTVAIDSVRAMQTVARAAALADSVVDILVEVDTGFHRCGLTGSAVVDLAQMVHQEPGLRFRGLMSFAGHIAGNTDSNHIRALIHDEDQQLGHYRRLLAEAGLSVDTISVGGTILAHHMEVLRHATEVRPGIYIFNDRSIIASGAVTVSECAARVWATVVSCPSDDRAVLDAGSKTLSTDGPILDSYGLVVGRPDWRITRLSEEHAVVQIPSGASRPQVGERVEIIPNHVCTVINLQNNVVGIRRSSIEVMLPIYARGGPC
ncbi:MAG: alanine racemase [Firmicutes bacterium]|nr:alanine racemase [Bacillota bacterium]